MILDGARLVGDGLTLAYERRTIAEDLTVAIPDRRVAVFRSGRLVELGPADQVLSRPASPYARTFLDLVPDPGAQRARQAAVPSGLKTSV